MGEMAYSNVSSLARRSRNSWRELYERLGKNFKVVMHLLWDFVQTTSHAKNTDLLAAYREWGAQVTLGCIACCCHKLRPTPPDSSWMSVLGCMFLHSPDTV